jgi:hypothetical protein
MTGRTLVQLARNAFLSATLNGRALFTWDIWSRGRRRPIVVSAPPTRREAILRVWCSCEGSNPLESCGWRRPVPLPWLVNVRREGSSRR